MRAGLQGRRRHRCCENGVTCNQATGICGSPPECATDADCVAAGDAHSANCCGGVWAQTECCNDDQDPNARCTRGSTYSPGDCSFACKRDSNCATGTCRCNDGTCSGDCCPGETPTLEPGVVTELPKTGSGNGGGNPALLGAALAAGTSALLAGAKLRLRNDES
jgi:LPXTG-motif cell wall-anchored protein